MGGRVRPWKTSVAEDANTDKDEGAGGGEGVCCCLLLL